MQRFKILYDFVIDFSFSVLTGEVLKLFWIMYHCPLCGYGTYIYLYRVYLI